MASGSSKRPTATAGHDQSHRSDRAHRSALLRWAGGILVVAAVVLALVSVDRAGLGSSSAEVTAADPSVSGAPSPSASPTPTVEPTTGDPSSSPTPVQRPGRRPTAVQAAGIDVSAQVVPIASVGRTLTPPSDVSEVGWWSQGARAGATVGSVLLTGHTVHTGGGVFDDLGDLRRGESVSVSTDGKPVRYRVRAVRYLTKSELAKAAPRLFDPTGPAQLVLVTCESWDGSEYNGNTIVVATPV